ncbi:MAG TPA: hypothetical protein VMP01_24955 [Pirellulaceae bacterium]|nr:hypothetical protein [Pirellulaceae bacterium]
MITGKLPTIRVCLLWLTTCVAAWLGMQQVHELGHVLGAAATGGRVERVVLHPLTISRTDVAENRQPLVVVWAGPLIGILLPLVLWMATALLRLRIAFLLRFFAGFCLIANGAYIGGGSFGGIGDCGEMLRHGSPIWLLWLFGLLTVPAGLVLWNGQGKHFGIGRDAADVDAVAIAASTIALVLLLTTGLLVG